MNPDKTITDGLDITVEKVTPEDAERYLALNVENRPISPAKVTDAVKAINRGEWTFNGDVIRFSDTGKMLDGQHRMRAIIEAGVALHFVVVRGLDESCFDTIDTGKKRTIGDSLASQGEANSLQLAAVVRLAIKWRLDFEPYTNAGQYSATTRQAEEYIARFPSVRDAVGVMKGRFNQAGLLVGGSTPAFCYHAMVESQWAQHANPFFEMLQNGDKSQTHCPIFNLRDVMVADRNARYRMPSYMRAAMVFKAFKKYCYGVPMKSMKVRTEGPGAERDLYRLPGVERWDAWAE